ncbi:MAG TPA: peptide chain release factor 1 [Spirochaetota bacterium]|nr:peptide chain release factor 1 [Spirochaetota bacterium]HOS39739.1 peptide chain release factor 1 [Spirochaetota bacterium]HPI24034.1 peptide chain release factor 1 [Spirochaetota bacterium]HPU88982.1 peptide chain release factor 1 [Spirochaetota bacterium]
MENKLEEIARRCAAIEQELSRPEVIGDQNKFRELTRQHSQLAPVVGAFADYRKMKQELADSQELLKSEKEREMREMLAEETAALEGKIAAAEEALMVMLLPKDPNSGKNILMEIRAGTGGEEAALFAADLFRMYTRYNDRMGFKMEIMELSPTGIGGYKEIIFSVAGSEAFDNLKFESGVHRVQRIPTTESGGRIHTSAVTVAVMPEAEESDIAIKPDEIRIDVYRASGHGGQSVNTTDSAVRITHIPTGMIVTCQDEKSQLKNKTKALRVLRARLFELKERERQAEESKLRKSQVGSGDRSERIRTYNFPQSRVTDHRVGLTLHSLATVLDGELDEIIEALKKNEVDERLKASAE